MAGTIGTKTTQVTVAHTVAVCDRCGQTSAHRHPLAQHFVTRHLPHRQTGYEDAFGWRIERLVYCADEAEHGILAEACSLDQGRTAAKWAGPGWYADRTRDTGDDGRDDRRLTKLTYLILDTQQHITGLIAHARDLAALDTAPPEPPPPPEEV